ncbi:MAG: D-amino-acid transaminase [Rhodobacteraceae bacterium]|nr:D-amino-acid transaminase [Paracoccaceae bacterium]
MSRTVYVNGDYLPEEDAKISVFDRGFLMADAVYEVTSVIDGKMLDFAGHATRLMRSLGEIDMKAPCSIDELEAIHREMIKRNDLTEGLIYLQVTRGIADRDFVYPDVEPSMVLFTQAKSVVNSLIAKHGMKVISIPDIRWGRRDIKTVQLLAPSMGKMAAKAAGADDAWLVEDGFVTEGTSNNAYIVKQDGTIVTRDLSHDILSGITREAVLRFAAEAQIKVEERPFTIEEAKQAKEAFVTSATTFVGPVVEIDGVMIGDGKVGDTARRLREIYISESLKTAI